MAEQSPIDIPAGAPVHSGGLTFHYGPSTTSIVDDGYAVGAEPSGDDRVVVDGRTYRLVQYHLHSPGEHTFDGRAGPMELHLVHADDAETLVVVGVVLEKGGHNPALETLLSETRAELDPTDLLPSDRAYIAYQGSLTAPPHTEGVSWRVLVHPIHLSTEQLARFRDVHHGNARPVQPLEGREFRPIPR